ncbi:hypothetical protein [Halochromatium salexigens]|uniref:Uncharacterized protein n=1 Tax=Halochromatium salexigens TaxID=49447 RepID=A0AAJ0UGB3_HALSE|nr:hypothetical protein [Halochromatium salexigens]MBK5930773.1 hypothetical protein [Halochromatium salexigens]
MPVLLKPSSLFGRPDRRARPPIVLLIGAHREELSFGDAVAEHLDRQRIDLLRIPVGISGRRPGPDAIEGYRRRHAELYRQILEHVQPEQRVLIDLHTGFDERLYSADVLCAEPALLSCIERERAECAAASGGDVRPVRLVTADREAPARGLPGDQADAWPDAWPRVRPELPVAVYASTAPLYIGVEVYLAAPSRAASAEARFAAAVIAVVGDCGLSVTS